MRPPRGQDRRQVIILELRICLRSRRRTVRGWLNDSKCWLLTQYPLDVVLVHGTDDDEHGLPPVRGDGHRAHASPA